MSHVVVIVDAKQQAEGQLLRELLGAKGVSSAQRSQSSFQATGG